MDNITIRHHLRVNLQQLDILVDRFAAFGIEDEISVMPILTVKIKTIMFLWYMANSNSFREISDRFNVAKSWGHHIILHALDAGCALAGEYIQWPDNCHKRANSKKFFRSTRRRRIIGAIDGCHIRFQKPPVRGVDYFNRKHYFSILLQGIVNASAEFIDIFVGIPGRVHDARMLRMSPFFSNWQDLMGDCQLLGDSAYNSNDFPFIVTPRKNPTDEEAATNKQLNRGRVIVENAFGRLKCRWRRLRDLVNTRIDVAVKVIIVACVLHNITNGSDFQCHEIGHENGCPRGDDDNVWDNDIEE